jgi:hypothetical protein
MNNKMVAPVRILELAHNWRKQAFSRCLCASAPVRQSPLGDSATGALQKHPRTNRPSETKTNWRTSGAHPREQHHEQGIKINYRRDEGERLNYAQ